MREPNNKISTVILAAGFSTRMKKFKPLAIYDGKTFLENIISKTDFFSTEIIIVTGYKNDAIREKIDELPKTLRRKIKTVFNKDYNEGMFSSVKTGISAVTTEWALLHFIDQPSLPIDFYTELTDKISDEYHWVQPSFQGKNGHPILLKKKIFKKILNAPTNATLKDISESFENKRIYKTAFRQTLDNFNTLTDF